jgi:hypothetical protein
MKAKPLFLTAKKLSAEGKLLQRHVVSPGDHGGVKGLFTVIADESLSFL